ncbi:MAG TPA: glycoside hydrolase family 13 protein [Mycobacteriales bacterium]|nr:glycoside hydrolase family 13 protein [Mycobacteriales bacterium]
MSAEPWWRSAVIYQVYPRSFADGNGDGIGDLAGLRSRLPYLASLGVDAVWISPWYPSPQVDAGYNVSDFRAIDPVFGTLQDAEALLREAHELGLKILLDIVPNHTSDQHAWFQAALAAAPGSPERDRYVFRPGKGDGGERPPTNWTAAFGGSMWERLPDGEWYLHMFAPEQPDLNWDNPQVRSEFEDVLRFWFDRGVDGFRIDVAGGLVKDPAYPDATPEMNEPPYYVGHPVADQDGVHDIYRGWRKVADSYEPPRIFVGEVWVTPQQRLARYVRPDELHSTFNFDYLLAPWDAPTLRQVIDATLAAMNEVGAPPTWVLSNHDVVRHATRFGRTRGHENDPVGAVPTDREQGVRRARAAALVELALPGGAYVYQGDELALPEVEDLPESVLQDPIWERSGHAARGRDGCRVPVPWSGSGSSLGFGSGTGWLPQPPDWAGLSVEAQDPDAGSTLNLYRSALRLRSGIRGELEWLETGPDVLGFRRGDFACLANMGATVTQLPPYREILLSTSTPPVDALAADQAVWLRI